MHVNAGCAVSSKSLFFSNLSIIDFFIFAHHLQKYSIKSTQCVKVWKGNTHPLHLLLIGQAEPVAHTPVHLGEATWAQREQTAARVYSQQTTDSKQQANETGGGVLGLLPQGPGSAGLLFSHSACRDDSLSAGSTLSFFITLLLTNQRVKSVRVTRRHTLQPSSNFCISSPASCSPQKSSVCVREQQVWPFRESQSAWNIHGWKWFVQLHYERNYQFIKTVVIDLERHIFLVQS